MADSASFPFFEEATRTFVESLPLSWLDDLFGLQGVDGPEFHQSTLAELRERVAALEADNERMRAELDRYKKAALERLERQLAEAQGR